MRSNDTPIFDTLAREFESQRPLIHIARAMGADPLGDPLALTSAFEVTAPGTSGTGQLPRRSRREAR